MSVVFRTAFWRRQCCQLSALTSVRPFAARLSFDTVSRNLDKSFHTKTSVSMFASDPIRNTPRRHEPENALLTMERFAENWTEGNDRNFLGMLGPSPSPAGYFRLIMMNMVYFQQYLDSVEFEEFRDSEVETGSDITRGREVLMNIATAADRWMNEAMALPTAEEMGLHDDSELVESLRHMHLNKQIISAYKRGELPSDMSWQDVCDVLLLSLGMACQNMSGYVAGKSSSPGN
ncbi:hypothetical protein NEOLEDRAFT_1135290 [Neolentinus lepideus HHB14362 ss-1]|uniref:Uncharacterized protein n=1 Tax=Neolentinus lepideus HHB14362 ss-1 TaxID=1314782 RepID=A0A165RR02_9AGAM|nr:hypothetical protein NEOLEDRAFT_1135290 [Neolentinus lepideus HHB14362 ss-1]